MKKPTKFWTFIIILLIPLVLVAGIVILMDPFFHYHKPIPGVSYLISEERYQNDGIVKHFDYEAIITGSSETQSFKTSDFERIFGKSCVKTSFAGGTFKEVDDLVRTGISANPNIKYVVRSLDLNMINDEPDTLGYDEYPTYLYNKDPFDDYEYIFNKQVFLTIGEDFLSTLRGIPTTSFDEYASVADYKEYGKDAVLRTFTRVDKIDEEMVFEEADYDRVKRNLEANIIKTARENPQITFYYFIPPYSVCYWDATVRSNSLDYVLTEEEYAIELLLDVDNIKVFSFSSDIDMTGNLDNYFDTLHFSSAINAEILQWMHDGTGLITKDNYHDEINREREIYSSYDYDEIFEQ